MKNYEAVFIITPVLSEAQMKETVDKFSQLCSENNAEIYHEENWGLRKLAYPISDKKTGFYQLIEFKADPQFIAKLETEFRRDERVMRFMTISLDKYATEWNTRRREKGIKPKAEVIS